MARYHINPSNKVLRCSAQSADSCPYGSKAHFEGDGDQAKFMQDALDRNLSKTPPKPKAAPKAEPAVQAPRISPYPPLRSATTKPPFPYGPGSGL